MKIKVTPTPLADLVVIDVDYFADERGFFIETWHKKDFAQAGLDLEFVQDSHSKSKYGVLRGLHYQDDTAPMGKLLRCTHGKIFDVAVDLRVNSKTFGKWFGLQLSAENKKQLYVPVGFAHGFAVMSAWAEVQYKQTGFYTPTAEGTVLWNDKNLGIKWPIKDPILSKRDRQGMSLVEYLKNPAFK